MNPETIIMNQILTALSKTCMIFRANVGTLPLKDGRFIATGKPTGFSDIHGHRKSDGRAFYIEVKTENGKATKQQKKFINRMKDTNALAGIARSVEEAKEIINGN